MLRKDKGTNLLVGRLSEKKPPIYFALPSASCYRAGGSYSTQLNESYTLKVMAECTRD